MQKNAVFVISCFIGVFIHQVSCQTTITTQFATYTGTTNGNVLLYCTVQNKQASDIFHTLTTILSGLQSMKITRELLSIITGNLHAMLSAQEREALDKGIGYDKNATAMKLPREYIEYQDQVNLSSYYLSLVNYSKKILQVSVTQMLGSFETRPAGDAFRISCRTDSFTVEGASKEHELVLIVPSDVNVYGRKVTHRPRKKRLPNCHITAVEISPPYQYKEKPYEGILPEIRTPEAGLDHPGIPNKVDKFPLVGSIPKLPPLPSIEEQEEFLKGPGKPFIKSKEYNYQPRTTIELIELLREKFGSGYYGIRHLFKSNDPTGKGSVTREALQRILYTLCGYITPDQYTKLLKEMQLDVRSPVHFDTFVQYFKDTEDKKNWVSAIQAQSMHATDHKYPETYLRRNDLRVHDPYTSMPFSDAIFKEKCKSKNFDAHRVFPPSVFEVGGLILPPQLREAYATLGIYMTDEDFNKLWQRYDKEGTGALHTDHFFRICGLDSRGKPRQLPPYTPRGAAFPRSRPHSEIGHTNGLDTSNEAKRVMKKEGIDPDQKLDTDRSEKRVVVDIPTARAEETKETEKKEEVKQVKIIKPKVHPKLDNVIDALHYKFEENYQAMFTAFQLFDFLNDNYVSKVDFRRVLSEFGLTVAPTEFDHFMKKSSLRAIKGQLNYKDFLNKCQNRSDSGIMARITKDASHPLTARGDKETPRYHTELPKDGGTLSAEQLESRLTELFHGDFIKMLNHFKQADKYSLGVITAHEFRTGIERRLGYGMNIKQWEQIKADIGQNKDGLIPYIKLIEMFDITPGAWNVRQEGNIQVLQVPSADVPVPSQVERLKDRAKTEMVPPSPPPPQQTNLRTIEQLRLKEEGMKVQKQIDELFKTRFHTFDKNFKAMDRRMTGRMSKWQFGALLKMTGLALQPKELDKIWATLNVSTDGMYSYSTLIQHFVHYKVPYEEKENIIYGNMFNVDEDQQIWYTEEEDTSELVETAKKIQRERRMEQMQRDHIARQKAKESNEEWTPGQGQITAPPAPLPSQSPRPQFPRAATTFSTVSRASSVPSVPASRASFTSTQSVRTKELLVKIRTDVVNNWDGLKSVFKFIDKHGTATIPIAEMKDIMNSMHFSMDEDDREEVCKRFDTKKDGRFNYLQFMKCYAQKPERKGHGYNKYTHQLEAQLFKEHRTLRRAFQKLDRGHKGYLNVQDFRKALKMCNITFTNEDFYHILTEFDHNMDGKITYENFLKTMLTV